MTNADFEAARKQMLARRRKVIYNTDGCDALYYPADLKAGKAEFIGRRLAYTRGSKVDTVFYCPIASGFCQFTVPTDAGDRLLCEAGMAGKRNVTHELFELGTDPLKIAEEYCRSEGLEFFVSIRVNDTHDRHHRADRPFFLFPPFKAAHPEVLFGTEERKPPFCSWTAVDFTHAEVRDRMAAAVAEFCERYDIDGIEYDFMRHMQLFRSVGFGGHASEEELALMTDFMKRLRAITEEAGRKRGRPILVAVRTPDSAGYSRAVGIDLERWMKEKLFDIHIGSSYFRLEPWRTSAELAHRYGIPFYASLDETRTANFLPLGDRSDDRVFYAREHAAFASGCDGVYLFNQEYEKMRRLARGGDEDLRGTDKIYYAATRGEGGYPAGFYVAGGEGFRTIPRILPESPHRIRAGASYTFPLTVGDDPADGNPVRTVMLRSDAPEGALTLRINGQPCRMTGHEGDIYTFEPAPGAVRRGDNAIEVAAADVERLPGRRTLLAGDWFQSGQSVSSGTGYFSTMCFPLDGGFSGCFPCLSFQLRMDNDFAPDAAFVRIADGKHVELIRFTPGDISFRMAGTSVQFKTCGKLHHYEVRLADGMIALDADGERLLEAPLAARITDPASLERDDLRAFSGRHACGLIFATASSNVTPARWRDIALVGRYVELADFALGIAYPKK